MNLEISTDQRELLIRLLEESLGETRSEVRRSMSSDFREQVLDEEAMLKDLLEKLRRA